MKFWRNTMRVRAILGWSCSAVLFAIFSLLISAYVFLLWRCEAPSLVPVVFAALLLLFFGCCLIIARFCRKRGLDPSGYGRCALLVLLSVPVACHLTFRKNRTFRELRKHYDLLIEGAGKRPPETANADAFLMTLLGGRPDIRNMGGWCLVAMGVPSFKRASEGAIRTKVLSDLLAIEIGSHLGQPRILDDYYSGAPYMTDKLTGRAFSVGPDKKPNTDDDIVLGEK